MHTSFNSICLLAFTLFLASCQDEAKPDSRAPILTLSEAQEITRTSALLTGQVETVQNGQVSDVAFRYGISPEMTRESSASVKLPKVEVLLENLQPGTLYYYCLEAGNKHSSVRSQTRTFTTHPVKLATLNNLQQLSRGPFSIILQYDLPDDGGAMIEETGFYYKAEGSEEQKFVITPFAGKQFRARIGNLQANTSYSIQAYAVNQIGEARSESLLFNTSKATMLNQPGLLPETIDWI